MNLLAWLLTLTLVITLMVQSVTFYKATVCRQRAWLKGTELITRTLLHKAEKKEFTADPGCRLYVTRHKQTVSWQRLPNLKKHELKLRLKGKI